MNKKIIIAIDGHSSCGKSTLAKEIAKKLAYIYVDTGAMYRAATLYFMQNNLIDKGLLNTKKIESELEKISIEFRRQNNGILHTFLNGEDVEKTIRTMEVANLVSEISKHAIVRKQMVALQQEMGKNKGIILDGRDIGTIVYPEAEVKIFLTADAPVRAKRRFDEIKDKGEEISFEAVLKNITDRDYQDENRDESPLKKADDAIVIDNSHLTREEQLNKALEIIQRKL